MAKFELELDDKGDFVGTLAPEVVAVFDRVKSAAHGEGYGKGAQKAAEEAKGQIASAVAAERAKLEAQLPLERAKWADIENENKTLREQLTATASEARRTLMSREEAHAAELTKRVDAINKRDAQIKAQVSANLRAMAAQAGARDESLPELEVLLRDRIGYDEHMMPFVKNDAGERAKTTAGNDLPVEMFVRQYLEQHPHHRKPAGGRGGEPGRRASAFSSGTSTSLEQARARFEGGDRSPAAINDIFEAARKKTA